MPFPRAVSVMFAAGVAGLFAVAILAYPMSLPLPAGMVLHIASHADFTFTVGPGGGVLVGAWRADAPTLALVGPYAPNNFSSYAGEGRPLRDYPASMNGSFDQPLAPGTYILAFGTLQSWSVPLLSMTALVNVTVSQTIQVVYGP